MEGNRYFVADRMLLHICDSQAAIMLFRHLFELQPDPYTQSKDWFAKEL
jgi:hypothetical protein